MRQTINLKNLPEIALRARRRLMPSLDQGPPPHLSATIAIEGLLAAVFLNLATAYTQMFASRMGASDDQIGLINSLPQLLAMLVLIPGALLASRVSDRRRPVELAILAAGMLYGIAGFSPWVGSNRVWFLVGIIALANAPVALYNTTWQSYFSNVVPIHERNSYFTRRTSMTFFASIIILQGVGLILGSAQNEAVRLVLYQCCYWLAFLVSILQYRVLRRGPNDPGDHVATGLKDLLAAGREITRCRGFVMFCLVSLFFHIGWYMAWPLFFLIQVNYMGSNETWLALVAVPASVVQWLTVRFWGRFIERRGIRITLVIGCIGLAVNPMMAVLAAHLPADLQLPGLLVFNLLNGFTFGAFQLSILQCLLEVVPVRYRTINISTYTTVLLLANAVAPLMGVRLYSLFGSDLRAMTLSLAVSSAIRLLGTAMFLLRWYLMRNQTDCGIRT